MDAKLSASVLCPGLINTAILEAERNRPSDMGSATDVSAFRPMSKNSPPDLKQRSKLVWSRQKSRT